MENAAQSSATTDQIRKILHAGLVKRQALVDKRKNEAPQKPEEKGAEEKSAETVTLHDLDRIH